MEHISSANSTVQSRKCKPKLLEANRSLNDAWPSRLERQVSTNSDTCLPHMSSGYSSNEFEPFAAEDQVLYRVLYDYKATHYDELTLAKNSLVKLVSKDVKISGDEGWWTGVNLDDAKRGIFPCNYVEPYTEDECTTEQSNDRSQLPPRIEYADLDIQECIGAGGFGKVFKGFWRQKDNRKEVVAVKEARAEVDSDDLLSNIKQNVLNEAKLFWVLRHPNIIQLKGICLNEPHFCLIMEYAKGGSLGRLLNLRKIGFPPNILIRWALQVSQGMYYLHEQALPNKIPIVHRDLKSSNILLSEDALSGQHKLHDIVLKLTDFGLARELEKTSNEMSQAGTYSHMPPEVIKSSKYSKASDVWSFGVLLWELLTGELPYKGIDPLAIAYGVAVNKLTLPIPSSCPKIFADLIHGCWHTDPHDRLTFEQIIVWLTDISNSAFAATSNELFWTMQQDWKCEIKLMFDEIKQRENELRTREQELERISMRQQAYESMLRQRERQLEQREKELAVRELTVALQQLQTNPVPPEPRKRRKTKLLSNFLRSSLMTTNSAQANLANSTNSQSAKSFDISTPSDFQHCLSIQPELVINSSNSNLASYFKPNESCTNETLNYNKTTTSGCNHHFILSSISGNSSPSLRLKIMVPDGDIKEKGDVLGHQNESPNRSHERFESGDMSFDLDCNLNESGKAKSEKSKTGTNSHDLESSAKKNLAKILYEIGSMLSFVGLGKEFRAQSRRTQEKKAHRLNLKCSASAQSHSLTRFHKTYPYRFKSLTNYLSQDEKNCQQAVNAVESVQTGTDQTNLSSSSSNLLSPQSAMRINGKLGNHEMLKKYSKSIDCAQNLERNSTDNVNRITGQRSVNCSPLIPRRNDYEPVARVTIQRQQRVEQSPPKLRNYLSVEVPDCRLARPLTLNLKKSLINAPRTMSTNSTSEDDYLKFEAKDDMQSNQITQPKLLPMRDSLSLSVSSVMSLSQPSSISPLASPRLSNNQSYPLKRITSQKRIDHSELNQN